MLKKVHPNIPVACVMSENTFCCFCFSVRQAQAAWVSAAWSGVSRVFMHQGIQHRLYLSQLYSFVQLLSIILEEVIIIQHPNQTSQTPNQTKYIPVTSSVVTVLLFLF
jgi:hypothetical protein